VDPSDLSAGDSSALEAFDVVIVGGGPAGLSAAVAVGRLNRRAVCFETGTPRTAHAPRYFNYLGFPDGIPGTEMLRLGRQQAGRWGARVRDLQVLAVERFAPEMLRRDGGAGPEEPVPPPRRCEASRFLVRTSAGAVRAGGLIFATGIEDRQPRCGNLYGERGIHYCVICDGYETRGSRVAVVGSDRRAFEMLQALRDFTTDLHLLLDCDADGLGEVERATLEAWGVEVLPGCLLEHRCSEEGVTFRLEDGSEAFYPHVFVALGAVPNTRLAAELGCELDADGYVVTDDRQATTVPFVYAAGDCDGGHKQVTQAMAEGELAAIELAKALRADGVPPLRARELPEATLSSLRPRCGNRAEGSGNRGRR
jgi:thioredoxin reductase (NADPH)